MAAPRRCANCSNGMHMLVRKEVLCVKRGIISEDYACRFYNPCSDLDYYNQPHHVTRCIQCADFVQEQHDEVIGICKLFTVRKFNGAIKNSCSRFTPKNSHAVSCMSC